MGKSEGGYKLKKLLIAALMIMLFAATTLAQTEELSGSGIAAKVNGEVITMDAFLSKVLPNYTEISKRIEEVDPLFSEMLLNTEAGQKLLEEYERNSLEALIEETLIIQYAREAGIEADTEVLRGVVNKSIMDTLTELDIEKSDADLFYILKGYIDGLSSYEAKVVRDLAYKEVLNALYEAVTESATVTEEEVEQYYLANSSKYAIEEERANLKVLLFDSFSEAYSVWKTASRDANPASVLDTFPEVQSGSFTRQEIENLNPELVKSLFKPTNGELLSSVVTLDNKYAVIYLESYSPAGAQGIDDVREEIRQILIAEKEDLLWRMWKEQEFKAFKEGAVVERYYETDGGE